MTVRNTYALEAWNRKGGAHSCLKKPTYDETEEGILEYEEEKDEQQKERVTLWAG